MARIRRQSLSVVLLGLAVGVFAAADCRAAEEKKTVPSADVIAEMLAKEPITRATWPTWRSRHVDWFYDYSNKTKGLDEALEAFVRQEAQNRTLPDYLAQDAVAWNLYGRSLLHEKQPAAADKSVTEAQAAFRRSIELDSKFASPHGGVAATLISQAFQAEKSAGAADKGSLLAQAEREIDTYARLDSRARPAYLRGVLAMARRDAAAAENWFRRAMEDAPESEHPAIWYARAVLSRDKPGGNPAEAISPLLKRFPQEGQLQAIYAIALAMNGRLKESAAALDKARKLGTDPAEVIGADAVAKIDELNRPSPVVRFLWLMAYFAGAYGGIMALMACTGVLLGVFTRGGAPPADGGSPAGAHDPYARQFGLQKLYLLALTASLILFYVAIPFVIAGLLGATGAMLYGIFMLGRIPIKLVLLIVIVGLGMVWAVLKSIFASAGAGMFGIRKTEADCPRFHGAIREVAGKVETGAVDDVYLSPGAEVCVRQEGRGPFGIFGIKRRMLTVGMANLRYLTVGELKAILAHEYAHFSHRDTFYSRFIHQVTLSVDQALKGMGAAGGKLNYINPFFWFFVLYYRAYSLLAAGFSRSQEYQADRVAAGLYGKDVFLSGLTKVATNGTLFETTAYDNIQQLMSQGKAFTNVYEAFASYRDEQLTDEQRQKMYEEFINQKASMFASHPTVRERMAAVATFPHALRLEDAPALSLFDQPEEVEQELSDFLTGFLDAVRQMQAAAGNA